VLYVGVANVSSFHVGGVFTLRLKLLLILPTVLVAVIVKVLASADSGVPVTAPVEEFRESPLGKDPDVIENVTLGYPIAVTPSEYIKDKFASAKVSSTHVGALLIAPENDCVTDPVSLAA
jgi:hypothetical protein